MRLTTIVVAAFTLLGTGRIAAADAGPKPNVIVIITDDQGYGDFSRHGNPVLKTPNLDRLAGESIRLTDFHVAPMCTPTRGQLMTGVDCLRNGAMNVSSGRTLLRRGLPTMADVFAANGYRTGHFGKWHLGDNYPYRPTDRGFQESIFFPSSHIVYIAVTRQDENLQMPPKDNDRLSAEQIEWLRQWIEAGAPWSETAQPAGSRAVSNPWDASDGVAVSTSGGLSPEWTNRRYRPEDIWAFQPIQRPTVPSEAPTAVPVRNPIDSFIQAKTKERGVTRPAPRADRLTLIRRATFDLTGLPPRLDATDAFLADKSPTAFQELTDRLLKSPQYGEQQTRHWLDVVRYADTGGFSNDYERPNAWRYRDYVIRSFNQDKPFDRFVVEQLAGDELEPDDPEMHIAVGFLRMGPWEHTGMTVAAVTRQQYLDDITHNVGVAFLGQGLRCARCHDHKFDPVPTRDYYRIQSVFASTQFVDRKLPFQPHENIPENCGARAGVQRRLDETKQTSGRKPCTVSAGRRPTAWAGAVCSRANWCRAVCVSCRFSRADGTRTITSTAPTPPAFVPWTNRSPR